MLMVFKNLGVLNKTSFMMQTCSKLKHLLTDLTHVGSQLVILANNPDYLILQVFNLIRLIYEDILILYLFVYQQTDWIFDHLDGGCQDIIKKWTIGVDQFQDHTNVNVV